MITDPTILMFALMGAARSGNLHGTYDSLAGNKFRGAYLAADNAGLIDEEHLRPVRNMFVHGYLGALPEGGVKTDADGVVIADQT